MKRVLWIVAIWVIAIWAFSFFAARLPIPPGSPAPTSSNPLDRWDATFYQGLAEGTAVERKDAFLPLYPLLVRGGMILSGGSFALMGSLLNTLLVLADALLCLIILKRFYHWSDKAAAWAIAALLAMPTSFSLLAPYAVALLLLLTLLTWLGLKTHTPALALGAASLSVFAHPSGIVLVAAAAFAVLHASRSRQTIVAFVIPLAAAIVLIWSGLLDRFLTARNGFSTFPGIHFWEQGTWYLTHHVSIPVGAIVVLGTLFTAGLTLATFQRGWKHELWLGLSAAGLFFGTVLSGLWIGLPRLMIPALLLPIAIAQAPLRLRLTLITGAFVIQLLWLYAFVSWKSYV